MVVVVVVLVPWWIWRCGERRARGDGVGVEVLMVDRWQYDGGGGGRRVLWWRGMVLVLVVIVWWS